VALFVHEIDFRLHLLPEWLRRYVIALAELIDVVVLVAIILHTLWSRTPGLRPRAFRGASAPGSRSRSGWKGYSLCAVNDSSDRELRMRLPGVHVAWRQLLRVSDRSRYRSSVISLCASHNHHGITAFACLGP
jgi:hypothetical protein